MTMTPEELKDLQYKHLKTSDLIRVLQHLLETEGDKGVYARDTNMEPSGVYGTDVYMNSKGWLVIYP